MSRSSFWTAGIRCKLWSFKYVSLRASMTSSVTAHIFSDDLSNIEWGAQWLCVDSGLREDDHLLDNFVMVRARKRRIMVSQLISLLRISQRFRESNCTFVSQKRTHQLGIPERSIDNQQTSLLELLSTIQTVNTLHSFSWCERCLLITESPRTPSHYRYRIWVLVYIDWWLLLLLVKVI